MSTWQSQNRHSHPKAAKCGVRSLMSVSCLGSGLLSVCVTAWGLQRVLGVMKGRESPVTHLDFLGTQD